MRRENTLFLTVSQGVPFETQEKWLDGKIVKRQILPAKGGP